MLAPPNCRPRKATLRRVKSSDPIKLGTHYNTSVLDLNPSIKQGE